MKHKGTNKPHVRSMTGLLSLLALLLSGLLAILPAPQEAHAQLDVKHYIPPFFSISSRVENHYLMLSTPATTPVAVTVEDGAGTLVWSGTVSNSGPVTLQLGRRTGGNYVSLTSGAGNILTNVNQLNTNTSEGLIVTASAPIYANIRHSASNQGASLTAKGYAALGTRFRAGLMRMTNTTNSRHCLFIAMMATEDNTTVNLSDIKPGVAFYSGGANPFQSQFVLNANESYVIGITGNTYAGTAPWNDVNGTLITSDKPIAVSSGSWEGSVPGTAQDIGIDQMVSESLLGSEYILMQGNGGSGVLETPIVIATANSTNLSINGGAATCTNGTALPMNAGEYCFLDGQFSAQRNMLIQASQPVYVFQTLAGSTSAATPGMNFIPPLSTSSDHFVDNIPNVNFLGTATVNILAQTTATVDVNGAPIGVAPQAVPGTPNWVTYRVTGLTGHVAVDSSGPIAVQFTNLSGLVGAAGYYAGLPVVELDWGDLPPAYGLTTQAAGGARHSTSSLTLGATIDSESDGQESAGADGDDTTNTDDEDGVTVPGAWAEGAGGGAVDVTVSGGLGCLSAWLDWDGDNNFSGPDDPILAMVEVSAGANNLTFDVPAGTTSGDYYARFRLVPDTGTTGDCSDDAPLVLTGLASNGEVEDHLLAVTVAPTAVELVSFTAAAQGDTVRLAWETASEVDNLGFHVYRQAADGERVQLNDTLIPSQNLGSPVGAAYEFVDGTAEPGVAYAYWLEDVDLNGTETLHGPVTASTKLALQRPLPVRRLLPPPVLIEPGPVPLPIGPPSNQ